MTYYRIIDSTEDTKDREHLLDIGAAHYGTRVSNYGIYRKFALNLSEDELLMLKLTLDHSADISPLDEHEITNLKTSGYLK